MTRDEIAAWFPANWTCLTNFGALTYAVPTLAWIQGPCYAAFRNRYWAENLSRWTVRWECRDFARAFACFAQECWATTQAASLEDGVAVGEIWFRPDPNDLTKGHAICPIFTENGLQYLEPQTGKLWPMSPEQLASRYFLRF